MKTRNLSGGTCYICKTFVVVRTGWSIKERFTTKIVHSDCYKTYMENEKKKLLNLILLFF